MRLKFVQVLAAIFAVVLMPAAAAHAQAPAAAPAAAAKAPALKLAAKFAIDKSKQIADPAAAKAQAIALATPMLASAGQPCNISDARYIGSADVAGAKPAKKAEAVEVACTGDLGYFVVQAAGDPAIIYDCIATTYPDTGKPTDFACTLPENINIAIMKPILVRAQSTCTPAQVMYMGEADKYRQYEAKCDNGEGQIIQISKPSGPTAKVSAFNCIALAQAGKPFPCKLTTEEANLVPIKALGAKATPPCNASKARYVTSLTDNTNYFELACGSGGGVMVQTKEGGDFIRSISCAKAASIHGGCTLSDPAAGVAQVKAEYTTAAKAAGFNCDVSQFQIEPVRPGVDEAVELACASNQPNSVLVTKEGKTMGFNCGRSLAEGYGCRLGPAAQGAAAAAVTAQLKKAGHETCTVKDVSASVSAASAFLEVTCTDGNPGYVIRYARDSNEPTEFLNCGQAERMGGCRMPGNKKS